MSAIAETETLTGQIPCAILSDFHLSLEFADIKFLFKTDKNKIEEVPAHKVLLAAHSDVFRTMFNGSWKEKTEVTIDDANIADFKELLRYFYFGTLNLTCENVAEIMNLSNKYNLTKCMDLCRNFLQATTTNEDVFSTFELAILLEDEKLKKFCGTLISMEARDLFKTSGFLECNQNALAHLVELKSLNCSEIELFEACMSWVKNACKPEKLSKEIVQSQLGNSFHKIRFGTLTFDEFEALIPSYGHLFSSDEYQDIIQMIANKEYLAKTFSGIREKRCEVQLFDDYYSIYCTRQPAEYNYVDPPYFIKNVETTTFTVNEVVFLYDLTIPNVCEFLKSCSYRPYYREFSEAIPSELTIVKILNASDPSQSEEVTIHKGNVNLARRTRYLISKPILFIPGLMYEIRLKQNPPHNCASLNILIPRDQIDSDSLVQYHHDTFMDDCDTNLYVRGLITDMSFCPLFDAERYRKSPQYKIMRLESSLENWMSQKLKSLRN